MIGCTHVMQHGGNIGQAAYWQNYARELDTADRFLNCKAVKYALLNGQFDDAVKMAAPFIKVRPCFS